MKSPSISRRVGSVVAAGAAAALVLAACSNGNDEESFSPDAAEAGVDLDEVYDIGETAREDLQEGGQITLGVGAVGPDWDLVTGLADIRFIMGSMYNVGAWTVDPVGEYVLNEDYFLSAEQEITDDGTQVLTYELNPDAVWNDGTPIDVDTYEHTFNIRTGEDEEYDLGDTNMYDQVASFEREDDWSFTVTMEQMYQPWQTMFENGIIHPDVNTPDLFNDGFVDDIRPDWRAGPFILDIYDRSANVVSVVPNPNWWGEEPVLDRINFVQYESSADLQAFQNGEIDRVAVSNASRFSELESWSEDDYEVRRGVSPGGSGFIFNGEAREVADVVVREAMFQAIDREQLNEVRFQGLNWESETPGSWLLLPFDERYEDHYPTQDADPEGARETLREAGYEGDDDGIMTKDGEDLVVTLTTFGDDPTGAAVSQAFQTQMRAGGIDLQINNLGSGQFSEVIGEKDYAVMGIGLSLGYADPSTAVNARFGQVDYNLTNLGDDDLDEMIAELQNTEELDDRIELGKQIEQQALSTHFNYLSTHLGPQIWAYRSGLANIGPNLYETDSWINVGWRADSDHDGSDTGEDVEDLEDSEPGDSEEEDEGDE